MDNGDNDGHYRKHHRKTSSTGNSSSSGVPMKANRHSSSSFAKKKKSKGGYQSDSGSDSEDSSDSLPPQRSSHRKRVKTRPDDDWQIIEGLKGEERVTEAPIKYDGYMRKRRKWPTKGWHKRYFYLEKGILHYAKSPYDVQKGKYHGSIDIGMAVVTYKRRGRRIDIDAEENVYHVKVKNKAVFEEWLVNIKRHRLFRQSEFAYGSRDAPKFSELPGQTLATSEQQLSVDSLRGSFSGRGGSLQRVQSLRLGSWLSDNSALDHISKEVMNVQSRLFDMTSLLPAIADTQPATPSSPLVQPPYEIPSVGMSKKDKSVRARISFRKHRHKKSKEANQEPVGARGLEVPSSQRLSSSNPNIWRELQQSTSDENSPPAHSEARAEFCSHAEHVVDRLKRLVRTLLTEKERWRRATETHCDLLVMSANEKLISQLRQQNTELRSRIRRIQNECSLPEPVQGDSVLNTPQLDHRKQANDDMEQQFPGIATSLSVESPSEFFDAHEEIVLSSESESSSEEESEEEKEDEEEEEVHSEQSADIDIDLPGSSSVAYAIDTEEPLAFGTGRREQLPVPCPPGNSVNLWSILKKYIGKDLSKVSMPVGLNEPLGFLQKLCEEMEYTELLDKASTTTDPAERMVLVAAFAVSGYASMQTRAARKPFNPLLGETFECVREDKGWKFIAEQVSHHPPISACHCESQNFTFWQDTRVKTKFWGKSMEADSIGTLHLVIPKFEACYQWQKVRTKCHNVFVGSKWIEHVGDLRITSNTGVSCKLTFSQSSYWSNKRHELHGGVYRQTDSGSQLVHKLSGRWNEALYCGEAHLAKCIWRPGTLPEDHELYYGFTRFAIELNELTDQEEQQLPSTDTRLRPDQRYLEQGQLDKADSEKARLEQSQRERRRMRESRGEQYTPSWFRKSTRHPDQWEFTGNYWKQRSTGSFKNMNLPKIFE